MTGLMAGRNRVRSGVSQVEKGWMNVEKVGQGKCWSRKKRCYEKKTSILVTDGFSERVKIKDERRAM